MNGPARGPLPPLVDALGLRPLPRRLREAWTALAGAEDLPKSRFDATSLSILSPRLALPLWAGRWHTPRAVILTNLFNHRPTSIEEGWSVRRTQVEDFRGRGLTYDSHNGTDLAIPRGTTVVAPAPARVARVFSEFNRGGLKLVLDHGEGLLTCSAHLARMLVDEGDEVGLGEPVAISGYSGIDGFATFPLGVPHVHFNVWLDGAPVDPFARPGEASLWIGGAPRPAPEPRARASVPPPDLDPAAVDRAVASCKTPSVRRRLERLERRGLHLIAERNYYPTRFGDLSPLHRTTHPRAPRLHLPFAAADFDRVLFADDLSADAPRASR